MRDPDIHGLSVDLTDNITWISGAPLLDGLIVDTEVSIQRGPSWPCEPYQVSVDLPMTPTQMRTLASWLVAMAHWQEHHAANTQQPKDPEGDPS